MHGTKQGKVCDAYKVHVGYATWLDQPPVAVQLQAPGLLPCLLQQLSQLSH